MADLPGRLTWFGHASHAIRQVAMLAMEEDPVNVTTHEMHGGRLLVVVEWEA
jgi:hypothetical protein